ncbi:MAG: hypothetical protein AVDCRST_MAG88-3472 [uncultured Thermomicrobiales bacterium]|uniref:Uncharacterized protein n=1 Tax=uncultured Thermomicrobiales bacterium TaxID=1645740 RepID=A0A6J4VPN0_9BACT|nr:MAG: hypothetical protein AVDCRST_MAG88-3472 [uncultured Thermomicrobiales bacterium]
MSSFFRRCDPRVGAITSLDQSVLKPGVGARRSRYNAERSGDKAG